MNVLKFGKLKISSGFFLLAAAILLLDVTHVLTYLLPALLAHELGHLLFLRLFGAKISDVTLTACGAVIKSDGSLSYGKDLVCIYAGCAFSLIYAVAASLLGRHFASTYFYATAGLSLVLCVFNLLPALPLDGGRGLYTAALMFKGFHFAERLLFFTSAVTAIAALFFGTAVLLRTGSNFTLAAAGIYILSHFAVQIGVENNRRIL